MSEQKGKLPCQNYDDYCLNVAAPTKGESKKYRCILIDPPTPQPMIGKFKGKHSRSDKLHYKTMTIEQIKSLPVEEYAEEGCHLWLWTTNAFLRDSFDFMAAWNFKISQYYYLDKTQWVRCVVRQYNSTCFVWIL